MAAYYLNRQTNARKETFTNQITGSKSALNKHFTKRDEVLEQTHKQGFLWNKFSNAMKFHGVFLVN